MSNRFRVLIAGEYGVGRHEFIERLLDPTRRVKAAPLLEEPQRQSVYTLPAVTIETSSSQGTAAEASVPPSTLCFDVRVVHSQLLPTLAGEIFDGIFLFFSLESAASYHGLAALYRACALLCVQDTKHRVIVIGGKADSSSREVSSPDFHRLYRLRYHAVSAVSGYNLFAPWTTLARELTSNFSLKILSLGGSTNTELRPVARSAMAGSLPSLGLSVDADAIRSDLDLGNEDDAETVTVAVTDADVVVREPGLCECRLAPQLRRCIKDNPAHPSHRRPYWRCMAPWYESCGFFRWADSEEVTEGPARELCDDAPCAVHSLPSVIHTVLRAGPNYGRQYLVCSARQRCPFFRWRDREPFVFSRWTPPDAPAAAPSVAAAAAVESTERRLRLVIEAGIVSAFSTGQITRQVSEMAMASLAAAESVAALLDDTTSTLGAACAVFAADGDVADFAETLRLLLTARK